MRSILGLIKRSFRSHGCRFKRAVTAVWLACGRRRREGRPSMSKSIPARVQLTRPCLAAAALQLSMALDFTVHRRQFSDGLLANFVGFSFNAQTRRSSAQHVAAVAADLFPH